MNQRERTTRGVAILLLLAITASGLWLRWIYARDVSFYVDEYLTVRAADRILDRGLPLLPSGNVYSHGLVLSYLVAALLALGGHEAWLLRLPVLLLSTASIPLTYWFALRLYGRSGAGGRAAGLIAAALLAFAPEAILWGGRVRMYAPLQFTVLVATAAAFLWIEGEREVAWHRRIFVLAYWASILLHAEAMLLLPLWGLWALLRRGLRWCLRPAQVASFALSGLPIVLEILLRRVGPPVQSWVSPGAFEPLTRQYLGTALDWPGIQKVVGPLFLTPLRLPCTLLALGGLAYLIWCRRAAWQSALRRLAPRNRPLRADGPPAPRAHRALAYLYALLLPVLLLLLFVVDPSWKSPRYALLLLPHYFLVVGGVATAGVSGLVRWLRWRPQRAWTWLGIAMAVVLVGAGSWPSALAATTESVPSYDWAFAYVDDHSQAGDVVITFLCPAAFAHLGRCDYLAIPADFAGFAFQKDGRWVSGWDEVPLLDSAEGLRQVLSEAPRAWFVVDQGRFAGRYPLEFLQAVWDGMELVAAEREMLVFRSLDPAALAAERAATRERLVDFQDGVRLRGSALVAKEWTAGGTASVVLLWQARSWIAGRYTVFVHLVDEHGELRSQSDGPPLGGLYPTPRWPPDLVLPDRHTLHLASDLEPGRYRLEVGLYDPASSERLPLHGGEESSTVVDYVWLGQHPPPTPPQHRLEATFGDAIRLLGFDLAPEGWSTNLVPGATLTMTLHWETIAPVARDYTVFLHLVDGEGQVQAQGDGPPLDGWYPTSYWQAGEVLVDLHRLSVGQEAPTGDYRLLVGLYTLGDGLRLPVTAGTGAGTDRVPLGSLRVH